MKITDLHNHTTYSYDGSHSAEDIILNAISVGIDVVGICDHQFSLGGNLNNYIYEINNLKAKYNSKIKVLCGLEIGTRPLPNDFLPSSSKRLDYCIFESLDSLKGHDFYEFLEWSRLFSCPIGLAHTDIFELSQRYELDILKILAENNIFWEINTSGNYPYYFDFLTNHEKQRKVKDSAITLSVGSDTHLIQQTNFNRLIRTNEFVQKLGNPVFCN